MKLRRKNHRWVRVLFTHPEPEIAAAGIPAARDICKFCGTERQCIGYVGFNCLQIRSYVRADGIRFTGQAPRCSGSL